MCHSERDDDFVSRTHLAPIALCVDVTVCGVSCTQTLQYESANEIRVITPPGTTVSSTCLNSIPYIRFTSSTHTFSLPCLVVLGSGSGPVIVTTLSGGVGKCDAEFVYENEADEQNEADEKVVGVYPSVVGV